MNPPCLVNLQRRDFFSPCICLWRPRQPSGKNPERNCREAAVLIEVLQWLVSNAREPRWQMTVSFVGWLQSGCAVQSADSRSLRVGEENIGPSCENDGGGFYLSESNNHRDADLLACAHHQLTRDCLRNILVPSAQVIDRRWDRIWWSDRRGLDADCILISSEERNSPPGCKTMDFHFSA